MIYALRWLYNDSQRFTTVHIGSHTTVKKINVISLIEDVNRCGLIEIYSLAHVNRKKTEYSEKTKAIFDFLPQCVLENHFVK